MTSLAPGKIILSGEHAVVYGQAALATSVNNFVKAHIEKNNGNNIRLIFPHFNIDETYSHIKLLSLKEKIRSAYQKFKRFEVTITEVLEKPIDICLFALMICLEKIGCKPEHGFTLTLETELPIGCGMGASAAFINAITQETCHYFNTQLSDEDFLSLALEAENCQHGNSSGIDIYTSYYGGCLLYQSGNFKQLDLTLPKFSLVNTGTPSCSTGECVATVKNKFGDTTSWEKFGKTTQALIKAINSQQYEIIKEAIRQNNQLLIKLGVVPWKIQQCIQEIEQDGGAAKICGAGAISGDHAGIILCYEGEHLQAICDKYQFELLKFSGGNLGAHTV